VRRGQREWKEQTSSGSGLNAASGHIVGVLSGKAVQADDTKTRVQSAYAFRA
jgi:hypothetical protein